MLSSGQGLPAPPAPWAERGCGDPAQGTQRQFNGGQHPGDSAGQRARPCPHPRDYHPAGESILILFNTNQGGGALQLSRDLGEALACTQPVRVPPSPGTPCVPWGAWDRSSNTSGWRETLQVPPNNPH